jgi:hypothetical protein
VLLESNCDCCFGLKCYVDWLVEANISEKHALSIFRAEVISWDLEGLVCACVCRVARGEDRRKGPIRTNKSEAELDH